MKTEKALILAAGLGTRFGTMTEEIPKGFVPFKGTPMVIRSIENLIAYGVKEIIIATGAHAEYYDNLKGKYPQITTVYSPRYAETNSMYTLYNSRDTAGYSSPFFLLESDIVYEPEALSLLDRTEAPDAMLVSPVTKFQDQYYIWQDGRGNLSDCGTEKKRPGEVGELVGIHRLSGEFYRAMCADYSLHAADEPKLGYEYQLLRMSVSGHPVKVALHSGLQWYEIDDEADLRFAEQNVKID